MGVGHEHHAVGIAIGGTGEACRVGGTQSKQKMRDQDQWKHRCCYHGPRNALPSVLFGHAPFFMCMVLGENESQCLIMVDLPRALEALAAQRGVEEPLPAFFEDGDYGEGFDGEELEGECVDVTGLLQTLRKQPSRTPRNRGGAIAFS